MKLSIIITVYNLEDYLEKCVNSCLAQDIDSADYEIIVVNDGSTDHSQQMAEALASQHGNVRVINKENGGLSTARNAGIDAAKGDYIWFIDGDDYIEPNCLKHLLDRAYTDRLDVLCFNLKKIYPDGSQSSDYISHESSGKVYCGAEFIYKVLMPPSANIALYNRGYLQSDNLRFYQGLIIEDIEFTPRAYSLAKRIEYINECLYYYFQHQGSIMHSRNFARRCRSYLTIADSLHAFTTAHFEKGTETYNALMRTAYYSFTESLNYYTSKATPLKQYKQSLCYPMDTSITTARARTKARIANFSLRLYIILSRLQNLFDKKH